MRVHQISADRINTYYNLKIGIIYHILGTKPNLQSLNNEDLSYN